MTGWLIRRGIADITGEPWGVGMMGYAMPHQRTNGILSRQYARALSTTTRDLHRKPSPIREVRGNE